MLERALWRHHESDNKTNGNSKHDSTLQDRKLNDALDGYPSVDDQSDRLPGIKVDIQGFEVESGVPHQPFGDGETKLGARTRSRNAAKAYKLKNGTMPHLAIGMEGGLEWHETSPRSASSMILSSSSRTSADTASNGGGALPSAKNGKVTSQPLSATKELYCMAWMAIYGRRYVVVRESRITWGWRVSHVTTKLTSDCSAGTRTGFVVDVLAAPDTRTYTGDKKAIFGFAKTASFALPREIVRLVDQEKMELGDADDLVFQRVKSKHGGGTVGILTHHLVDRAEYYEHALQLALIPWIRPEMYPRGTS
jgi:non-canonical (house-cleaning) NTP pyrophosphatase